MTQNRRFLPRRPHLPDGGAPAQALKAAAGVVLLLAAALDALRPAAA